MLIYVLFIAVFLLQGQSWVVMTENVWLTMSKIFMIWSFAEEICPHLIKIKTRSRTTDMINNLSEPKSELSYQTSGHPRFSDLGSQPAEMRDYILTSQDPMFPVVRARVSFWKVEGTPFTGILYLGLPGVHTTLGIETGTEGFPVISPPRFFEWGSCDLLVFYLSIFHTQWCGASCQERSNEINCAPPLCPGWHFSLAEGTRKNITTKSQQKQPLPPMMLLPKGQILLLSSMCITKWENQRRARKSNQHYQKIQKLNWSPGSLTHVLNI